MHATEELARFVADHPAGKLPDRTRTALSRLILDLMAATAAGHQSPLASAARATAIAAYGAGPAQVWFSAETLGPVGAAMANAAAASALDIDDGHRGAAGHPGAGVIPAAFAVGQALGASDEAIFDAVALGYDVALRVATARPVPTIQSYASGLWVSYGVAAAVGRLLGLSAAQLAHAMAIAGLEGPLARVPGGTRIGAGSCKESIPPAVTSGITAAYRAKAGATGPIDILDTPELYRREILTGGLGDHWWLEDCYFKPYACCRYMHAAVDALAELRDMALPVKSLRIETFGRGLTLGNSRRPSSLEAGQFSYPFSTALAALRGIAALQPVALSSLSDPEVLALSDRIELVEDPALSPLFPASTPCRVILDQGKGPEVRTVLSPLGDVGNPIPTPQLIEKFRRITAQRLSSAEQSRMLEALGALETAGLRPLFAALAATDGTAGRDTTTTPRRDDSDTTKNTGRR